MIILLTIAVVVAILAGSEFWWRRRPVHGEFSRKLVHITVGSFVAFWPYFLSSGQIKALSAAFIVGVAISKHFKIFNAIHSVQRPTWGELWFALVVGLLAFTLHHPHVYTAALLVMSLADGLAAVVGTRFGKRSRYSVFGSTKSVVGTLTFFVVSCLILLGYDLLTSNISLGLWLLPIALAATLIENVAVKGLDNLLVPLMVAVVLFAVA